MTASTGAMAERAARISLRSWGRRLLGARDTVALHWARLQAALLLPDAEPVQGTLADLFYALPNTSERRAALTVAQHRLSPAVAQAFGACVASGAFPHSSRLATRWSVLVSPSLDQPRRALRCNADDSRALAQIGLQAWERGDEWAQAEFLEHCRICRDTLAFMLARQAILKRQAALPAAWEAVSNDLQQLEAAP